MHILDQNTMTLKGNKLANSKLQIACVYNIKCKSNKLQSMMTLNNMFYKVNTFSLKLNKVILSVSL